MLLVRDLVRCLLPMDCLYPRDLPQPAREKKRNAIVRSSGFRPSFASWTFDKLGLELGDFPPVEEIHLLLFEVQKYARSVAQSHWRQKRQRFSLQLDGSMRHQGGKVPFALLRDQQ